MLFDLSQYVPFNAFVFLWLLGMLAYGSTFNHNDKEGK